MNRQIVIWSCVLVMIVSLGCGSTSSTNRIDVDEDATNSTETSAKDLRSMARTMAADLLQCPQIKERIKRNLPPAKIAFANITNETRDYDFSSWEVLTKIRGYLIKHSRGYLTFLESEKLDAVATEGSGSKEHYLESIFKTNPQFKKADYMLTGRAFSKKLQSKDTVSQYHSYTFWLTHVPTRQIVWQNDYEVKKASQTGALYGRE